MAINKMRVALGMVISPQVAELAQATLDSRYYLGLWKL